MKQQKETAKKLSQQDIADLKKLLELARGPSGALWRAQMSEAEEILREVATAIDDGVEEEDIVLYDYVLAKLREKLLRLLEAGQAIREERIGQVSNNSYWIEEWDAAKAAIRSGK